MIKLVQNAIDTQELLSSVADDNCGASVLFTGSTRRWTGGAYTEKLGYEAHESMAIASMHRLADQAKARWSVVHVSIVHRLGEVGVGEISVAVAVSSPHRKDSFEAASWLIDTLKKDVPIWKCDFDATGNGQWVHPHEGSTS